MKVAARETKCHRLDYSIIARAQALLYNYSSEPLLNETSAKEAGDAVTFGFDVGDVSLAKAVALNATAAAAALSTRGFFTMRKSASCSNRWAGAAGHHVCPLP